MPRFAILNAIWLLALFLMGAFWWADRSILADQVRNLRTGLECETRLNNTKYGQSASILRKQLPDLNP